MKPLSKQHWLIIFVLGTFVLAYTWLFLSAGNAEFMIYVAIIVLLGILILVSNKSVKWSTMTLWGLTIWAILHMSGGGLYIDGVRLYEVILIPLSNTLPVFRYDQFVHMFGFFVATMVSFELIRPLLKPHLTRWTALSIVLTMAGLGFGALNEIVEFTATLIAPETGVGGYINTSLDLVSNFVGSLLAVFFIRWKFLFSATGNED